MNEDKRTFKFRVWIPDEDGHGKMFPLPFSDGKYDENISKRFPLCEAIIMQFTGLKDEKGKEIYEGDVLKDDRNRILLVEWWNYAFTLKALSKTNFKHAPINQWFYGEPSLPEVIGNIYESPEFLTSRLS